MGDTVLWEVSSCGHSDIVEFLLDFEVDINFCKNTCASSLFACSENGHVDVVRMLLDKEADINKCKVDGVSPLNISCSKRYLEVAQMLNEGADVNLFVNTNASLLYVG
eukprot:TRINITY_DN3263_c1_g3_i1.p1 TRINITY_DN3263_c1_g3~~TRINITY_DN3263_c1_g3_i1.p1  ORF type:complete len:108 (-),score=32.19 TRINITY_DN3263_c1_g3_i1:486-809(-)